MLEAGLCLTYLINDSQALNIENHIFLRRIYTNSHTSLFTTQSLSWCLTLTEYLTSVAAPLHKLSFSLACVLFLLTTHTTFFIFQNSKPCFLDYWNVKFHNIMNRNSHSECTYVCNSLVMKYLLIRNLFTWLKRFSWRWFFPTLFYPNQWARYHPSHRVKLEMWALSRVLTSL